MEKYKGSFHSPPLRRGFVLVGICNFLNYTLVTRREAGGGEWKRSAPFTAFFNFCRAAGDCGLLNKLMTVYGGLITLPSFKGVRMREN